MSRTNFKKVLFQTLISGFLSFSTFAIGIIRVYYFSKQLSVEEFGVLSLMLTLSAFLMYIFTLGSFQYLFKSVHAGIEESRSAFWASLLVTAFISLICVFITYFCIDEIASALNLKLYKSELELTILATASTAMMITFLFFHYGLRRNNFQNLLQFLRGSLWVIASILFSLFFKLSLYNILIIVNLCMLATIVLAIPWKELKILSTINFRDIKFSELIKYCIPLLPYYAGVWGIPMILRTQLNVYSGAKKVALFSVAYTLMEILFMFVSTITATLSPYFFSETISDNKPGIFYNIMLKYSILCIVLIVPFVFVLRYDIILLIASEQYAQAGDYIPLLTFFPLLRVLIVVFEQHYLKSSETIFLGVVYLLGILLCFIVSLLLIPTYFIYGAIIASLVSYSFIFICLCTRRRHIVDFEYVNISALIKLTLTLWVMIFALSFAKFSNFYKIIPLGITALLSLFLFPVLNEQEKTKLLSMLKIRR